MNASASAGLGSAPTISVVLPTFNHLRFLPDAMADVFRQTRSDWELIVVNDGSTDGTEEWLNSQSHDQLRVIHQENRGPHEAINAGILAARGSYVTWISADNRCAPYFLEALAAPLDLDPACAFSYSPYYGIDEQDRIFTVKYDNLLLLRELVTSTPRGNAGFLYRKAIHDAVGLYEGWACDTLMWSKIAERHEAVFVLEPTYFYRFHQDRATVREQPRLGEARRQITVDFLARHRGIIDDAVLARLYPGLAQLPEKRADATADFALRLFRGGFPSEACKLLLMALASVEPNKLLRPLLNFTACAATLEIDPIDHAATALDANGHLSDPARAAAIDVVHAVSLLFRLNGNPDAVSLELNHALCLLEKPKVFSYTAWKAGLGIVSVTAY